MIRENQATGGQRPESFRAERRTLLREKWPQGSLAKKRPSQRHAWL